MDRVKHLRVMKAISLVGFLPVIAAIFFAGTIVVDKYAQTQEAAETKELLKVADALTNLMHEQQKERGMSAVYIATDGTAYGDKLAAQYEATDAVFDSLAADMAALDFSDFTPDVKLTVDQIITDS